MDKVIVLPKAAALEVVVAAYESIEFKNPQNYLF